MFALLTTKTTHHIYYENQIYRKFKNIITIFETEIIKPSFQTNVNFEKKRNKYEKKVFFKNKKPIFKSKTFKVANINNLKVIDILKKNKVKYLIVFGTKKITSNILKLYKDKIFNLHGGNPEEYRGLDSHYWSIYHNKFNNLVSCIHILNKKLDDGKIIFKSKLKIPKKTKIHQLREINTKNCINISFKLLKKISKSGKFKSHNQNKIGRYYSFMPKNFKYICQKKFENFYN